MSTRTVLVPVFDRVQGLDVTGPVEVFHAANDHAAKDHAANALAAGSPAAYDIRIGSLGGAPVRTESGITLLPSDDLRTFAEPIDTLVVPGGDGRRNADPELVRWLRETAPTARRLMSVCTGAFLLADAGLLSGRRVTTHWHACAELAQRYPDLEVDPEPIFVRSGSVLTSAGVTAGIDAALTLVTEDLGRTTSLAVARELVMFLHRPANQAQFSARLAVRTADRQPLRQLQEWIVENPRADLSVPALAERAHLSSRQFARAFRSEVGISPGEYVNRVRLEAARQLLEDSPTDPVERIAALTGHGTAESMRRAFIRALGISPSEYRRRFSPPPRSPNPEPTHPLESAEFRPTAGTPTPATT